MLAPPGRVRFVDRYVTDAELPAFFRRADVLALPHRNVDVSGVLFAGLAFGKAMVLSDIGAFANWWRRRALGGWWPRTIQKRSARRSPSCSPTRPPARRSRSAPRRRPPAATLGPHRRAHAPGLPRGAGVRAVYLGKSKRSPPGPRLAGRARLRGPRGRGGEPDEWSARAARGPSWPRATACG